MKQVLLILSFLCLIFNTNVFSQKIKQLPDKVFIKYFSNNFCACIETNFNGFSPEFITIWEQIGKDFKTKKGADLANFYAHLKNNPADSLRFNNLDQLNGNADDCLMDFEQLEEKYDFDFEEELTPYLSRTALKILNKLKKDKKCSNAYIVWAFFIIQTQTPK